MRLLLLSLALLLSSCATHQVLTRDVVTTTRRTPALNKIDAGRHIKPGEVLAQMNLAYAVEEPGFLYLSDSSLTTVPDLLGNQYTRLIYRQTYCTEPRLMVSGEGLFAIGKRSAIGLSFDMALGEVTDYSGQGSKAVQSNTFEGALSWRVNRRFGAVTAVLKPEFLVAHLYGDSYETVHSTALDSEPLTARERLNEYEVSLRCSGVLRAQLHERVAPYAAFQVKTQPFFAETRVLETELAMGFYAGVDLTVQQLAIGPYVALPLKAAVSHYQSPVAVGLSCSYLFARK